MSSIRLLTDEDVYGGLASALRAAGQDAISTPEAGRLGETDESQLEWASVNGLALVTFNVGHFAALHGAWLQQGKHHAGIIVSSQRPFGDLLRRLLNLSRAIDGKVMQDRLEFLGDW